MKVFSNYRRIATAVVAVIAMAVMASCGSSTPKYGCPNHLSISIR